MRLLISLVSFLLSLVGLNPPTGPTTLTLSVDAAGLTSTKSQLGAEGARFECLHSASGRCHYVVFVNDCARTAAPAATEACATRVLERFTLASGQWHRTGRLPAGVRHCLDPNAMPVAPGCAKG